MAFTTVIFGFRIPESEFVTERRKKAFKHSHPEDWIVDPKTGRELWENVIEYRKGFEDEDEYNSRQWCEFPTARLSESIIIGVFRHFVSTEGYGITEDSFGKELPANFLDEIEVLRKKLLRFKLPVDKLALWIIPGS